MSDVHIRGANGHATDDSSAGFHVSCNSIGPGITCDIYSVHCVSIQDTALFAVKRKRGYQM